MEIDEAILAFRTSMIIAGCDQYMGLHYTSVMYDPIFTINVFNHAIEKKRLLAVTVLSDKPL